MTKPYFQTDLVTLYHGNNLDILPTLADNSVDSIVTDPPYELGFMGKKWDNSGIAYSVELWTECLRVLKPGGHLLSFGGTRTWHRVAVAIEDAGFEVRDSIAWMYGSGFPKSLDVSKAIDKAAGAERGVLTETVEDLFGEREEEKKLAQPGATSDRLAMGNGWQESPNETTASTLEAQQWEGWGTALKPAFEPIVVARKPLIGTVAENVLTHGTGGLNIDGSRIGTGKGVVTFDRTKRKEEGNTYDLGTVTGVKESGQGRWPANVILDEYSAEILDEQSGIRQAGGFPKKVDRSNTAIYGQYASEEREQRINLDSGGASRFFYVAKASKRDRNEGLDELEASYENRGNGFSDKISDTKQARQNFHPTVKPTALMEYLIKLVTPPNGTVLDPFTGSGSTGKAAIIEGFDFIGIELTAEYLPIIEGRLKWAEQEVLERERKKDEGLF